MASSSSRMYIHAPKSFNYLRDAACARELRGCDVASRTSQTECVCVMGLVASLCVSSSVCAREKPLISSERFLNWI